MPAGALVLTRKRYIIIKCTGRLHGRVYILYAMYKVIHFSVYTRYFEKH
jgi:hypothetical protein